MITRILKLGVAVFALVLVSGCQTWQPLQLEPVALHEAIEHSRNIPLSGESTLTFAEAAERMEQSSPMLMVVRKEYEGWQKVAGIKTPWPNPTVSAGPSFGSNLGSPAVNSVQPFLSLGFSIPLGPRLIRNDELNGVMQAQAYNHTVVKHRELFFRLRHAYVRYWSIHRLVQAQTAVAASYAQVRHSTQRLVELGSISPMGLTEADLQTAEIQIEMIKLHMERESVAGTLARLIGVKKAEILRLAPSEVASDLSVPDLADLKKSLLTNNTALSKIEMNLLVADAELRVELARQYPDLTIGLDGADEVGDTKRVVSIPIGISLPIFDQNQHEIAKAKNERELQVIAYQSELSDLIAALEEEGARLQLIDQKVNLFKNEIIPAARKNAAAGERALALGSIDILRYLDLVSKLHQQEIEYLHLEEQRMDCVIRIEEVVGVPLIKLE